MWMILKTLIHCHCCWSCCSCSASQAPPVSWPPLQHQHSPCWSCWAELNCSLSWTIPKIFSSILEDIFIPLLLIEMIITEWRILIRKQCDPQLQRMIDYFSYQAGDNSPQSCRQRSHCSTAHEHTEIIFVEGSRKYLVSKVDKFLFSKYLLCNTLLHQMLHTLLDISEIEYFKDFVKWNSI